MIWFAYATAWLSCSIATIVGLYYTHNVFCLCAMVIPLFIKIQTTTKGEKRG